MALIKPILNNIVAFDATIQNIISFTVPVGGDQVTANRLTIINQTTGLQVYQATQTTFALQHTLPADTLVNGQYYSAFVNTFNAIGTMSANSNTIQFYCFTTPSFTFTNLPVGNIIANNAFNFEITYNQTEGELLNSYRFDLYDAQQTLVSTSGVRFVGSVASPPTVLTYEFGGFADNTVYYVKGFGSTLNGTSIETPLTLVTVKYTQPNIFAIVELSQNCTGGYVTVKSNMANIEGTSNPTPPIYIDDEAVDLTQEGSWVNWNQNQFDFSGDWTLGIWGRDFTPHTNTIKLQNAQGDSITISYRQGYYQGEGALKTYVDCMVTSGELNYYVYSNYIDNPLSTDTIQLWLRRINNIYQINIYNLT